MTPIDRYQFLLQQQNIQPDSGQLAAVTAMDNLHQELKQHLATESRSLISLGRLLGKNQQPVSGIYLWGGVGRGKTFLMDLFFECLPTERKFRTHFHRFMQRVHNRLSQLQGRENPLQIIGKELAQDYRVLCLDEFFVLDIGDAMLLSGLLRALFEHDLVLVTTSNLHPDELYADGLQRESFLPAIELLKKHCLVFQIEQGMDYRLRQLEEATLYHYPTTAETADRLRQNFLEMAPDPGNVQEGPEIEILGRAISARMCCDDLVWFEFDQLCHGPRSAFDYVEIARLFHAVFLSGLPALDDSDLDATRRLVNLVDEFYDRRVKLIIAAEVPLEAIYRGERLALEFERCRSRLLEMQSREYLQQEHRS